MSNVAQSAYKQFPSTETALLKVHNDAALNMDKGKVTTLALLDLSAAFDTITYSLNAFQCGMTYLAQSHFVWSSGCCSWIITVYPLHYSTQLNY